MTPITWYLYGRSGGAKKAAEEIGVKGSVSGDIAVISDGADGVAIKSLVAEITPVQDLHGQANPYPAGGGKNLIPYPYTSQAGTYSGVTVTVNTDGTLVLNGTATATVFWDLKSGADAVPMTAGSYILHRPSTTAVTGLTITVAKDGNYWNMASQANTNLTLESDANVSWYIRVDNGTALSNVKVYPMFEKGTTASDWSPYENICPISGRTGLTVTAAGKNLIPNIKYQYSENSVYLGENNAEYKLYLPVGTYTLSVEYLNNVHSGAYYRLASDSSNRNIWMSTSTATSGTITIDKDEPFRIWLYHPDGISANNIGNSQIEVGSTATAYEPYKGQTYPVTWETEAGTVYGGTLDVVSGVLTVNHILLSVPSWTKKETTYGVMRFYSSYYAKTIKPAVANSIVADVICSCFINTSANDGFAGIVEDSISVDTAGTISCYPDRNGTVAALSEADFKTYMDSQQIIAALTEPKTYQLTGAEVRTLLGGNTIYTDAGAVSVEYVADTKLYIDNKVAELQALILEN